MKDLKRIVLSLFILSLSIFFIAQAASAQGTWRERREERRERLKEKIREKVIEKKREATDKPKMEAGLGGIDARISLKWITEIGQEGAGFVYGAGDYGRKLRFDGRERFYEIHVSSDYNTAKPAPVVLNFHGGGGYPAGARYQSGMDLVADKNGFIVVYPAGTGKLFNDRLLTWNDGRPDKDGKPYTANDVGFVAALLDDLAVFFNVDSMRIYATGISNGAQFSYTLANKLSDRIAAIATIAGHRTVDQYFPPPPRPISVMQFSGLEDKLAPYYGGTPPKKAGPVTIDFEWTMRPVKEAISSWAAHNGCSTEFAEATMIGKAVMTRFSSQCKDNTEVILWTLEDGGHTWPGGKMFPSEVKAGLGHLNTDISASELMWEFFKRHTLNNETVSGPKAQATDKDLSQSPRFGGEPSVAVSDRDPLRLMSGWMDSPVPKKMEIRVSASSDGGDSWTAPVTLPHLKPEWHNADISIVFDRDDVAHLTYIDWNVEMEDIEAVRGAILYVRSEDNGVTFTRPVVVFDAMESSERPIDRPWIAVDRSGGPRDGWIYVTSLTMFSYDQYPHHIHLKSSSDGGKTWSADVQVDDDIFNAGRLPVSMGVPDVGADGTLWVVYLGLRRRFSGLYLVSALSSDGGRNFTRTAVADLVLPPKTGRFTAIHSVAVDPARPGHAVVVWVDSRFDKKASDILFSRTKNWGKTWSPPIRLNDDPQGNGVWQDMPWLSFSSQGDLAVVWRDRRAAGQGYGVPFEIYSTVSPDGGETWKKNIKLSTQASPWYPWKFGNAFLGAALSDQKLHAVWADARTGVSRIFHGWISVAE